MNCLNQVLRAACSSRTRSIKSLRATSLIVDNTGRGHDSQFLAGIGGAGGFRAGISGLKAEVASSPNDSEEGARREIWNGGDFEDLVTKSTKIADKSLFIQDVIKEPVKVLLLAMPRRWGKTINLEMLKRFLEIEVDQNGEPIDKRFSENTKLFAGGKIEFDGEKNSWDPLKISSSPVRVVQGTYPVIHIDFSSCASAHDLTSMKEALRGVLFDCFKQHEYLANSDKLANETKKRLQSYIGDLSHQVLTDYDIKSGLSFLSKLLFEHHNRNVWILIDEYDAGLNTAYRRFSAPDLRATIKLFTEMLRSALKSNPNLQKGVMTGILRVAKTGMLSGLNNLKVFDFTDAQYAQYYGLDDEEVDSFMEHFGVHKDQQKEAKTWYNGYTVKRYSPTNPKSHLGQMVNKYNTWSIVNYLNQKDYKTFGSYWESSGSIEFFQPLLKKAEVREKVEQLVKGTSIEFNRKTDFSALEFQVLKEILDKGADVTGNGLDVLFSYLFMGGYLTIDDKNDGQYKLPNREIGYEMTNRIKIYYSDTYGLSTTKMDASSKSLGRIMDCHSSSQADVEELLRDFYNVFKDMLVNSKLSNDEKKGILVNESAVCAILFIIAALTINDRVGKEAPVIKTDGTGRSGRADIAMTKGSVGAIFEMKCRPLSSAKNEFMKKALAQAIEYQELINDFPDKFFIAMNVQKQADDPKERKLELLCAYTLHGEEKVFGINGSEDVDAFGADTSILPSAIRRE